MTFLEKVLGKKQPYVDVELHSARVMAEHCDWRIGKCLEAVRREKRRLCTRIKRDGPYTFVELQAAFSNIELELKRIRREVSL